MRNRLRILANHDIRHKNVRIVMESGSEVLPTYKAIEKAENSGLDLILVNENSDPPVCKILELDKYRYEMHRKEKEAAKAQRESRVHIKEVQFKPNIDEHDFQTKCRQIAKFIDKGNKVKVLIQFKGRQRQYIDVGYELLDRILESVTDIEYDGKPAFAGNRITSMLKGIKDGT